jgi:hypothetical protein
MFDEMLKSIQSGFSRIATPQRLFVLIIFLVLAWLLMSYSDTKSFSMDSMGTYNGDAVTDTGAAAASGASAASGVVDISMPSDSNARPIANPNDLLIKDENSEWAKLNPNNMGNVLNADLLEAGYHIGLNSIGSTMKNANLQLRSDPIIPKQDVGPWNQSTYEPDFGRVPLEVGYGPATK